MSSFNRYQLDFDWFYVSEALFQNIAFYEHVYTDTYVVCIDRRPKICLSI